jgi:cupin superfamily acireductone dioxygenase involved in methionine salvage
MASKLETAVRQNRKIAASVERHDQAKATDQDRRAKAEQTAAHRVARNYGFKVCDTKG